jgi:hypothetical protein
LGEFDLGGDFFADIVIGVNERRYQDREIQLTGVKMDQWKEKIHLCKSWLPCTDIKKNREVRKYSRPSIGLYKEERLTGQGKV